MCNRTPKTIISSALIWALRIVHNKGTPFTYCAVNNVLDALLENDYPKHLRTKVTDTVQEVLLIQDSVLALKKVQAEVLRECIDDLKDYNANLPRRKPPCQ